MKRTLLILTMILLVAGGATAAPSDFPRPAALESDVAFWKRIYSEVGTDGGLLHDTHDLSIVYEVVKLPSGLSPRSRQRHTDKLKKRYRAILLELAKGKRSGLSSEARRVLALFGPDASNSSLRRSADRIRFQLGQADKFRAGVIRSGAYKPHVHSVLRDMNLPAEIANLPHVESSYTPSVYSRIGAAGLWQFTRSTGRRFMRVDHVVDERLDPYRASIAAARLLEQNRRVTGSWPLAITAYNHGAAGMRRAARKLGTKDIVRIVRNYRSRTFGFASRNFYVEFLAANEVAANAEHYFGRLVRDEPIAYERMELPFYARAGDVARAVGVDVATLKEANPALRTSVWNHSKYVPKGYELRVPRAALARPLSRGIAAVPQDRRHARQTRDSHYTVRRGDTLSTIARRHGVRMSDLVALNGLKSRHRIRVGQKLRLPSDATRSTTTVAHRPRTSTPEAPPADGVYTVRRGDNLTRIAERFGLSVGDLMAMNDLRSQNRISVGQKLRISRNAAVTTSAKTAAKAAVTTSAKTAAKAAPKPKARTEAKTAASHPDAVAALSPARIADPEPSARDLAEAAARAEAEGLELAEGDSEATKGDESAVDPSPGLLADPSDYTVGSDGSIIVQPNETLGHFAEWLGLRASRLRRINGLAYGQSLGVQQRLRLDFSEVRPEEFERIRIDYHRALQEEFFSEWEIEGTRVHRVGPGDSLWVLSTRRLKVPIWLLRQYNPDVDLEALSMGTQLTVPLLRQRVEESSRSDEALERTAAAS